MKPDLLITDKLQIGNEIFAYLVENPKAKDTREVIVEWCLLQRQINFQTTRIKNAFSDLVARGFILEKKGSNSQIHLRVNQSRIEEIKKIVKLMGE